MKYIKRIIKVILFMLSMPFVLVWIIIFLPMFLIGVLILYIKHGDHDLAQEKLMNMHQAPYLFIDGLINKI